MIAFALAVFFMIVTPGPAVLALAGVGAAFSFKVGLKFLIGLTLGYLLVWAIVITGFVSIIFSIPYMRTIFLIISSGYLIYLSLKIMLKGSEIAFINPENRPTLLDGIILQLVNPKAYAFHSILLTGFIVFPNNFLLETSWKFIIMNLIWIPLHIGWLSLGVSIEKINLRPHTQRRINIFMGTSLMLVALLSFFSIRQI